MTSWRGNKEYVFYIHDYRYQLNRVSSLSRHTVTRTLHSLRGKKKVSLYDNYVATPEIKRRSTFGKDAKSITAIQCVTQQIQINSDWKGVWEKEESEAEVLCQWWPPSASGLWEAATHWASCQDPVHIGAWKTRQFNIMPRLGYQILPPPSWWAFVNTLWPSLTEILCDRLFSS